MAALAAVIFTVHQARSVSLRGYGGKIHAKSRREVTCLVTPAPIERVPHSPAVVRQCEQQTLASQVAVAAVVESSKYTLMQLAHTCSPAEADIEAAAHKPLCNLCSYFAVKLPAKNVCNAARLRQGNHLSIAS